MTNDKIKIAKQVLKQRDAVFAIFLFVIQG